MSRRNRKQKCNKFRKNQQPGEEHLRVLDGGAQERVRNHKVTIIPRNAKQDELLGHLENERVNITFAVGPAGTGKTLLSTLAAIRELKAGNIGKIIITRPAVSTDEQHGFLPGGLNEKMAPWVLPIMDIFEEYYTADQIEYMLKDKKIEIAPLAYMRGRTFKDAWIIADEMQLTTPNQMKMMLTRVGDDCKLVITGDLDQADRGNDNGLRDFLAKVGSSNSKRIKIVQFDEGEIERHPVVAEVLDFYS